MKKDIKQHTNEQKRKLSRQMIAICVCMVAIIITSLVAITLSKYVSTAHTENNATPVASFVVNLLREDKDGVMLDCSKGKIEAQTFEFEVTNTESEKVADVPITYDMTITLPVLSWQWSPEGIDDGNIGRLLSDFVDVTLLNDENKSIGELSEDGKTVSVKNAGIFDKETSATHHYTLKFTPKYDALLEETNCSFAGFKVEVKSVQKD